MQAVNLVKFLKVFFLENERAIQSKQNELKSIQVSIRVVVYLLKNFSQLGESHAFRVVLAVEKIFFAFGEDAHVVYRLNDLIERHSTIRASLNV